MNIFVLDTDPVIAARAHCDKHVVKMCTEYAQILSTAARQMGYHHDCYKNTHDKHPAVLWAAGSHVHWAWLLRLARALGAEYTRRYGREHAATRALDLLPHPLRTQYVVESPTYWPQCVPEGYLHLGVVESYREYYRQDKRRFARWKDPARTPEWFDN